MKKSVNKVLVLGGDGMLGHQLVNTLNPFFEVKATVRDKTAVPEANEFLSLKNTYFGIDVLSQDAIENVIETFVPEVVVNAVGIVKQRHEAIEAIPCIEINALFPHRLQKMVEAVKGRLIHISTDCVFSGRNGNYVETDHADAEDMYGRSKLLGEVSTGNAITLRTSMIGRELKRKKSLLEWFLKQKGNVPGYTQAVFSGLSTLELSRLIRRLISDFPDAHGLYHVSSRPINKYELLCRIRDKLNLDINVIPDNTVVVDRSLNATAFQQTFKYHPPTWETMITELA